MTDSGTIRIPREAEAGPFCMGTREFHNLITPANFAHQLDELRLANDAAWWQGAALTLAKAAQSKTGRLSQSLSAELARAIDSGLRGTIPKAFAAAAQLDTGTHGRASASREIRAAAYVLAKERGYIVDRSPVVTMIDALKIDRRTWHRWRENQDREKAEDFLYLSLCETALYEGIGQSWAKLAVLVALGLATEEQARELHLARGGRIVTGKDGQEVWVMGDDPLPPDI